MTPRHLDHQIHTKGRSLVGEPYGPTICGSERQASLNEFAWSTVASVIYLDSPAGVGLSYSETHSDYVTNDTYTAADADAFLRRFFRRFPEFLRNHLYIAGTNLPTCVPISDCFRCQLLEYLQCTFFLCELFATAGVGGDRC